MEMEMMMMMRRMRMRMRMMGTMFYDVFFLMFDDV